MAHRGLPTWPLELIAFKKRAVVEGYPQFNDIWLRWQGGSRDTAFERTRVCLHPGIFRPHQSGVAHRFPPPQRCYSN